MNQTKLVIPVLWDYGAEMYTWDSPFNTEDELKHWWLEEADLLDFTHKLRSGNYPEFEPESDRFWDVFQGKYDLTLVDEYQPDTCYLVIGNQRIQKNGVIYTLNRR